MLYPATCVGFGTGARGLKLSGFSREHDYVRSPVAQVRPVLSGLGTARGLPSAPYTYPLQPPIPSGGRTATSPSPRRTHGQYRNVDRSPFGVALRLSLRTRLTLIRLALIRKPWPCGEGVSRPLCRYSYLHLLFPALQGGSPRAFSAPGMLPYRCYQHPTASATRFMPGYYPCQTARLVSCYALFE